ncbi:MAG: sugar kinase [Pseudomonadota bacterium]
MTGALDHRYVLVARKTRFQELVERFNTWPQAKFYLEHSGVDASDYLREHDHYMDQITKAERIMRPLGPFQMLDRRYLSTYHFSPGDVVTVVGQDGLVANTLKYLEGQPVIGVNPDPDRWDGRLLPFTVDDLNEVLQATKANNCKTTSVSFAEATSNLGDRMLAVNDLFVGPRSHTSARYQLKWGESCETQSSSGIIISTGFGSTGWFQSILTGALGVVGMKTHPLSDGFPWDSDRLQFTVREPFPSRTTDTGVVFGEITRNKTLRLESLMPENGIVFSDGIEEDSISFNAGCIIEVSVSETQGLLVV